MNPRRAARALGPKGRGIAARAAIIVDRALAEASRLDSVARHVHDPRTLEALRMRYHAMLGHAWRAESIALSLSRTFVPVLS